MKVGAYRHRFLRMECVSTLWTALWISPITEIAAPGSVNNNRSQCRFVLLSPCRYSPKMDFRYFYSSMCPVRRLWIS